MDTIQRRLAWPLRKDDMVNQKIVQILFSRYKYLSKMNPQSGCILAMKGKNCVAIASDMGFHGERQIIGTNTPKVFKIHDKLFIGLAGLLGDVSSIKQILDYEVSNFLLQENRFPNHFEVTNILSNLLYKNRFTPFFIEPILAGLTKKGDPVISSMDIIGAVSNSNKFSVSGICTDELYGICESLWKPNMSDKELFKVVSKCINFATNRDCLSGWGACVYIVTENEIISKKI